MLSCITHQRSEQIVSVRQNPYGNTDQNDMRSLNITQGILTAPFGHMGEYRNNFIDAKYSEKHPSWASGSQDRSFDEKIQIGDIVIIPYKGKKQCIIAKITSDPLYAYDTKLFTRLDGKKIRIGERGDTPFRPVVRKIEIIQTDIVLRDKRILRQNSLSFLKDEKNIREILSFLN